MSDSPKRIAVIGSTGSIGRQALEIIAADDGLFRPMGVREELSRLMDEYNEKVFADSRLTSTILPIGDGLTISVKR